MKKLIALLAAAMMIMSFAGCGDKESTVAEKEPENLSRPAVSEEKKELEKQEKQENEADKKAEEKPEEKVEEKKPKEAEPEKKEPEAKAPAAVSLSSVRTAILNGCSIGDSMLLETAALGNLYAIDTSKVKQSASFVTMSGTFPHEIIMLEAKDSAAAAEIEKILQNRLGEVLNQSKSYDANNYTLAQKCRVVKNGNYLALFLSPENEKMLQIYSGYIK